MVDGPLDGLVREHLHVDLFAAIGGDEAQSLLGIGELGLVHRATPHNVPRAIGNDVIKDEDIFARHPDRGAAEFFQHRVGENFWFRGLWYCGRFVDFWGYFSLFSIQITGAIYES